MRKLVAICLVVFCLAYPAWGIEEESTELGELKEVKIDSETNRGFLESLECGSLGTSGVPIIGDITRVGELTLVPVNRVRIVGCDPIAENQRWTREEWVIEPVAIVVIEEGEWQIFSLVSGREVVAWSEVSDQIAQRMLEQGKEYLKEQDWEKAKETFEELLAIRPDWAQVHSLLGQALSELSMAASEMGDRIEFGMRAFQEFARALEIDPTDSHALVARGYARLAAPPPLGGADLAIQDFQEALTYNPQSAEAWLGLAEAYRKKGEQDKAEECYRKVLEIEPDNSEALEGLNKLSETKN